MTAGWRLFNSTVGSNPTSSASPHGGQRWLAKPPPHLFSPCSIAVRKSSTLPGQFRRTTLAV